jgi:hypothetical protein
MRIRRILTATAAASAVAGLALTAAATRDLTRALNQRG